MLQAKDVLCSLLYCVAIPAGSSANSITESARAVSPITSRCHIIFLIFIGYVSCAKYSTALSTSLLSSGMWSQLPRPLRWLVFSKTFLSVSLLGGSAVRRETMTSSLTKMQYSYPLWGLKSIHAHLDPGSACVNCLYSCHILYLHGITCMAYFPYGTYS